MPDRANLAVMDLFHPCILDALDTALPSGWSIGVAEPPVERPLLKLENVVMTPRRPGATLYNLASLVRRAFANAHRTLAGEPPSPQDPGGAPG